MTAAREAAALVLFAFGLVRVPPGAELAAPSLLRILADLGVRDAAARSALLRMRRRGQLVSVRRGRSAAYALTPAVLATQERLARPFGPQHPAWDGSFHALLYNAPERQRAFRDAVRRAGTLAGYGPLGPGLLIAPESRSAELDPALPAVPAGCRLLHAELRLSAADSREVAGTAWELPALAAEYRTHAARLRRDAARVARRPAYGAAALRQFAAATLPVYAAVGRDPSLPAELLPADWPAADLGDAMTEVFRAYAGPLTGYLGSITPAAGSAGA